MKIQFPFTVQNLAGEKIILQELIHEPGGDKIIGENFVQPKSGPPMHVHWLQDEGFTVIKGKIGYQFHGGPEQFATAGESIVFKRGVPHRFWNAGEEVLNCKAWVQPVHTFPFYINSIFEAQKKTGSDRPELFDAAYLLTRYRREYDMLTVPWFVRRVIFPLVYFTGMLLRKYPHFKNAPAPVKA